MDDNKNKPENRDGQGRTANAARPGDTPHQEESADISAVDRQEGNLQHGTINSDFSSDTPASDREQK